MNGNGKYEMGIVHRGMGGQTEFHFDQVNRPVNRQHVEALKASMETYGFLDMHPISVTPTGSVMDGQHRYLAATELGIPFVFIVTTVDSMDPVAVAGRIHDSWNVQAYLHYYATLGVPDYVTLREYMENHSSVNLSVFLRIFGSDRQSHSQKYKDGLFVWPGVEDQGWVVLEMVEKLAMTVRWAKHVGCLGALRKLVAMPGFDKDIFLKRLSTQRDRLYGCATTAGYLEMFLDVYNYRASANRIGT